MKNVIVKKTSEKNTKNMKEFEKLKTVVLENTNDYLKYITSDECTEDDCNSIKEYLEEKYEIPLERVFEDTKLYAEEYAATAIHGYINESVNQLSYDFKITDNNIQRGVIANTFLEIAEEINNSVYNYSLQATFEFVLIYAFIFVIERDMPLEQILSSTIKTLKESFCVDYYNPPDWLNQLSEKKLTAMISSIAKDVFNLKTSATKE